MKMLACESTCPPELLWVWAFPKSRLGQYSNLGPSSPWTHPYPARPDQPNRIALICIIYKQPLKRLKVFYM